MRQPYFILLLLLSLLTLLDSCSINSDIMFKTPNNYEFDAPKDLTDEEYKISPGDIIQFTLYANNGFMIIDLSSLGAGSSSNDVRVNNRTLDISYFIEDDGYVLPDGFDACDTTQSVDLFTGMPLRIAFAVPSLMVFPGDNGGHLKQLSR